MNRSLLYLLRATFTVFFITLAKSVAFADTYPVTTTADAGAGSLRQAILDANGHTGDDIISFGIGSGAQSIVLATALPQITGGLTIDGTSQPGYVNTPLITIGADWTGSIFDANAAADFAFIGLNVGKTGAAGGNGFVISNATNLTITNCVITNRIYGLLITNCANVIATNNDLTDSGVSSGWALYLNTVTGPLSVTGNTFGGNTTEGIYLINLSGKTISTNTGDIQVGTQIKELNTPLRIENGSNMTVTGLNLDRTGSPVGFIQITGVSGLTVTNNSFRNRLYGLYLASCTNVIATDNDLTDSGVNGGWALYLNTATGPLSVTGNTFGGNTTEGIYLINLSGKTISTNTGDIQVGTQIKELNTPLRIENGSNMTITGLNLNKTGSPVGFIQITGVSGLTVTNNSFRNRLYGLYVASSSTVVATGNDLTNSGVNGGWAMYFNSNSGPLSVTGNTFGGVTTAGVYMRDLRDVTIAPASGNIQVGTQLKDIPTPLRVEYGTNIIVTNLDMGSTTSVGNHVDISNVTGLTVTNNILRNRIHGLVIQSSSNITATGNDLTDSGVNGGYAIYLNADNGINMNISSNIISGSTTAGVYMRDLRDVTIAPATGQIQVGTLLKPLATPLRIEYGTNITMTGLDLEKTGAVGSHVDISNVTGLTVTNNILRNRIHGLVIQSSSNITATGNDLTDSGVNGGYAIYLNADNGINMNISSNIISGSTTAGVYMRDLRDVTIAPATGQIQVGSQLKPLTTPLRIEYGTNITMTGLDLEKTGAVGSYVDISNVTGLTVTSNILRNRIHGLIIQSSSNITATGNDLTDSGVNGGYAIYLNNDSGTLSVIDNTFSGSTTNGLYLGNMTNYTISDGSVANTNITIPNGSIFKTMIGTSVNITGGSGIWIENLDLANTGTSRVGTGIRVENSANFTATKNQIVKRITGFLISNDGSYSATLTCNNIRNNTTGIVFGGSGNSSHIVTNNAIWSNTTGLNNGTNPGQLINATNNWWGHAAGPITGSTSGTGVTTTPFSDSVPACVTILCPTPNDWASISGTLTLCTGTTLTLTASGAATAVEGETVAYLWSTGETTASISVSAEQAYSVTVTLPQGCTATASASVTAFSSPSLTITSAPGLTITQGQVTTLTARGADSFNWSGGEIGTPIGTSAISVSVAAAYSVTGTTKSCSATANVDVIVISSLTMSVSSSASTICAGSSVTFSATSLGGTTPYRYTWTAPTGIILSSTSNSQVTARTDGNLVGPQTLTITVTDSSTSLLGSSALVSTTTISIHVNGKPTATISAIPGLSICLGQELTLFGNYNPPPSPPPGGGIAPPPDPTPPPGARIATLGSIDNYNWSTGDITPSISLTPTSSTVISLTAYDGSCYADPVSVSIDVQNTPVSVSISGNLTICAGQTATLLASGGSSYIWSNGPTIASNPVSPTTTTSYTVVGSSGSCPSSATVTVQVNPIPVVTITPAGTAINGIETLTLTASGADSYTWSTPANSTAITVSPKETTTYSVTGSRSGCASSTSSTVTVLCGELKLAKAISTTVTSQLGPGNCSVTLKGVGYGTGYTITGPGGYVFSAVYRQVGYYTLNALAVKLPGTYTFTVRYLDACGRGSTDTMTYVVTGTACR